MQSFKIRVIVFICWFLLLGVTVAAAADCPALVQYALKAIDDACSDTGRNQACYGNSSLFAEPQPGIGPLPFQQTGDRVNLLDVKSLKLSAMDREANSWGVALLKVQANLPDTLPGQNVTFLLFGDVSLDNNQTPTTTSPSPNTITYGPMQAFILRTGLKDAPCGEAPSSGILIQSPETPTVQLRINAVNITLGSTIYVQLSTPSEMTITVLEGQATLTAFGKTVVAPAGMRVRVALDGALAAVAAPSDAEPYTSADVANLPLQNLPIPIIDPATSALEVTPAVTPLSLTPEATQQSTPSNPTGDLPLSGAWHAHSEASVCPAYAGEVYDYDLPNVQVRFEQDGMILFVEWADGQSLSYTRVEEGVYTATESNDINVGTYTLRVLSEDHMTVVYEVDNLLNDQNFDGCVHNIDYTYVG